MEFQEDAVTPMMEEFRSQSVQAQQHAMDDTVLNGDIVTGASANINLIDGTPASAPNQPSYLAFEEYHWVMDIRRYKDKAHLIEHFETGIIKPALEMHRRLLIEKNEALKSKPINEF
jgi:hypothetical protein